MIIQINLNQEVMKEAGLTLEETLFLLLLLKNPEGNSIEDYVTKETNRGFMEHNKLTEKGLNLIEKILGQQTSWSESELLEVATQMKAIYPKGRKADTNYYWADSALLIKRRLGLFFRKYGTDFTKEQIINATKKYVEAYQNDMQYMQLLKYFIFKEKVNISHEVESQSELLNYISNEAEIDDDSDWQSEIL